MFDVPGRFVLNMCNPNKEAFMLHCSLVKRFVALALLLAAIGPGAAQADRLLTIGAAPMGGTYYTAGVTLADMFKKFAPGVDARVEVTGGTVENPGLMQMGELDLGLANTDMAFFALNGMAPFKDKMGDLRGLFTGLAPGTVQYVVQDKSGILTVPDLKGKRCAIGPQGNSSGLLFFKVLAHYGLKPSDVTVSYLSFSDGVNAMLDGDVDMAIVQAGLPSPAIREAFAGSRKVNMVSFTEEERAAFLKEHPYYIAQTITKADYPELPRDIITFGTGNMVMVHKSLPADLVYKLAAAVFDHLDVFYQAHPTHRFVTLEDAPKTSIPLHEGAIRYFKDKGVLK